MRVDAGDVVDVAGERRRVAVVIEPVGDESVLGRRVVEIDGEEERAWETISGIDDDEFVGIDVGGEEDAALADDVALRVDERVGELLVEGEVVDSVAALDAGGARIGIGQRAEDDALAVCESDADELRDVVFLVNAVDVERIAGRGDEGSKVVQIAGVGQ